MNIRTFSFQDDLEEVLDLWRRSGPGVTLSRSDRPAELAKMQERDPELFLVAEQEGELVGTVLGGFDGRRGLVYHLSVLPEHRRSGIGGALMDELECRLREKGCRKAYLLVTKDNLGAVEFYEQIGWEPMDVHLLGKELT
ncbi:MAG: GNAT family acetyltransferase [Anaerolineales bacterium]|nr:GNAT family acetyltransferase [Anaerolineales bacterium]